MTRLATLSVLALSACEECDSLPSGYTSSESVTCDDPTEPNEFDPYEVGDLSDYGVEDIELSIASGDDDRISFETWDDFFDDGGNMQVTVHGVPASLDVEIRIFCHYDSYDILSSVAHVDARGYGGDETLTFRGDSSCDPWRAYEVEISAEGEDCATVYVDIEPGGTWGAALL